MWLIGEQKMGFQIPHILLPFLGLIKAYWQENKCSSQIMRQLLLTVDRERDERNNLPCSGSLLD